MLARIWILLFLALALLSCAGVQDSARKVLERTSQELRTAGIELPPLLDRTPSITLTARASEVRHDQSLILIAPIPRGTSGQQPLVLSVDSAGLAIVWDLEQELALQIELGALEIAQLSHRGRYLIVSRPGGTIELFDFEVMGFLPERFTPPSRITALSYHSYPRGSVLIGAADGRVYRWKGSGSSEPERYHAHPSTIRSLSAARGGRVFFSGDWDGTFLAWLPYDVDRFSGEYDESALLGEFFSTEADYVVGKMGRGVSLESITLNASAERLLLSFSNGRVELWSVRGMEKQVELQPSTDLVLDASISPSGRTFCTVSRKGLFRVWRVLSEYDEINEKNVLSAELLQELPRSEIVKVRLIDDSLIVAGERGGRILTIALEQLSAEGAAEESL